ncbi:uncharacterized protein B0H18DRAFT_1124240 [Fomitopsis serialis]|uniref:uncharacterized protein n=1 Tax=Fomitopsis serialis TaxID=139415 RepID=UPI002008A3BD|nr:uncharacterized protein B0H18DRAFT_1124240 [Neoantrodia serialis]KAH9916441.1 hypothetical protein B0H18DRAFT_1124240 [Neoantrodia serialis]
MDLYAKPRYAIAPKGLPSRTFSDALRCDPIAALRSLIQGIQASNIQRDYLSAILKTLDKQDLRLLRDVVTRWSSTLLMINHALELHNVVDKFLNQNDFEELRKYKLSDAEWKALEIFWDILSTVRLVEL